MNCTRVKARPRAMANERAINVLPMPGRSSMRTAAGQHGGQDERKAARFPTTTRSISSRTAFESGGRRCGHRHLCRHTCSIRRRISASAVYPGPGSLLCSGRMALGSTHVHQFVAEHDAPGGLLCGGILLSGGEQEFAREFRP